MSLAYVNEIAQEKKDVKFLLASRYLFDGPIDTKEKEKYFTNMVVVFWVVLQNKSNQPFVFRWHRYSFCWRFHETLQSWKNTQLLYSLF